MWSHERLCLLPPNQTVSSNMTFEWYQQNSNHCVCVCFLTYRLAVFSLKSFDDVRNLLGLAKTQLTEILSAFEFSDSGSLSAVQNLLKDQKFPLENSGKVSKV